MESLGFSLSFGIFLLNFQRFPISKDMRSSLDDVLKQVIKSLCALIELNPSASIPLYDNHFIDIALCLILLQRTRQEEKARDWVQKLGVSVVRAYDFLGRYFPVHTNSYDDLVTLIVGDAPPKSQLIQASTILPLLAEWHSILRMPDEYDGFKDSVMRAFPHTNIMLWVPDESIDDYLYSFRAGYSGTGRTIMLHPSLEGIKERILREKEEMRRIYKMLSCVEYNMFCLIGISSRHFRNPVIPLIMGTTSVTMIFIMFSTQDGFGRRTPCSQRRLSRDLQFFNGANVMSEQRRQAYLTLIEALLSCPNGQESSILQQHQDLIDEGLLRIMSQAVGMFRQQGQEQPATWLEQLAAQLTQSIETEAAKPSNNLSGSRNLKAILQELLQPSDWRKTGRRVLIVPTSTFEASIATEG